MRYMLAKNSVTAADKIKRFTVREYLVLMELRVDEILAKKQKKGGQNESD